MKILSNIFWGVIGLLGLMFFAGVMYLALTDTGPGNVREETVLAMPVCKNAQGDVTYKAIQGSETAPEPVFLRDERTILYDPKIADWPNEAREFALAAACARASVPDASEADCVAVKRLRDELDFKNEKVALITQHLAASSGAKDAATRVRNINACFEAR
ncbi:hypothetical protein IVB40_13525 [Bradyrhizobium sp. 40]|uniref:hypothetical protein n=1 Tax=Bradyrhizobium sp. 40 TaxID=2782674 RepID=UPI001FFFF3A8|nr:hypothetical protein [Bradyrhizobium sp. 40]UPJ44963.1 hypothetical protein IVB40_13525 [Bradyrhizobium sp. 40]